MKNATMSVEMGDQRLTFNFSEGEPLVLDLTQLNSAILEQAKLHGLKQKCVDAAALSRDPMTGKSATAEEKHAAVRGMIERLGRGMWNERGAGEGGGTLLNALCAAYPSRSRADLGEWLKGKTDKEKRALRMSEKLKPFLEVAPSGAGDAILAGLAD